HFAEASPAASSAPARERPALGRSGVQFHRRIVEIGISAAARAVDVSVGAGYRSPTRRVQVHSQAIVSVTQVDSKARIPCCLDITRYINAVEPNCVTAVCRDYE